MRYGVSMLQVVRVHPEPVKGYTYVLVGSVETLITLSDGSTIPPWAALGLSADLILHPVHPFRSALEHGGPFGG